MLLEVCVDTAAGAAAAQAGGAKRLELCSRLEVGGLTPARELVDAVVAEARVPVHVMVRPRAGDFVFAADEIETMRAQIDDLKERGAAGFALGALTKDDLVDRERTARLVERARPLPVTFHRAFDVVPDPYEALETLIELGIERVLTSGGAPTAVDGIDVLGRLIDQAGGRIIVMPGGGVRAENVESLVLETGATELHSSTAFPL